MWQCWLTHYFTGTCTINCFFFHFLLRLSLLHTLPSYVAFFLLLLLLSVCLFVFSHILSEAFKWPWHFAFNLLFRFLEKTYHSSNIVMMMMMMMMIVIIIIIVDINITTCTCILLHSENQEEKQRKFGLTWVIRYIFSMCYVIVITVCYSCFPGIWVLPFC